MNEITQPPFTKVAKAQKWEWPDWLHPDIYALKFDDDGVILYNKRTKCRSKIQDGIKRPYWMSKYFRDARVLYRADFVSESDSTKK